MPSFLSLMVNPLAGATSCAGMPMARVRTIVRDQQAWVSPLGAGCVPTSSEGSVSLTGNRGNIEGSDQRKIALATSPRYHYCRLSAACCLQ